MAHAFAPEVDDGNVFITSVWKTSYPLWM